MSNYLAIATATAALQQVLMTPVGNAVVGAKVGFSRPDAGSSATPLVNIFPLPDHAERGLPERRPSYAAFGWNARTAPDCGL